MPRTRLDLVLSDFEAEIRQARKLTRALSYGRGITRGRFTEKQYHLVLELAYLRGFIAWESFLEQTFLLYLMGKSTPSGFQPRRFVIPSHINHARDFAKGEQRYPDWSSADKVVARANMFFFNGAPYATALPNMRGELGHMKTIRNAIAHMSEEAGQSFERVVRAVVGYYGVGMTVGAFLDKTRPNSNPPVTCIEYYFDILLQIANDIVPS